MQSHTNSLSKYTKRFTKTIPFKKVQKLFKETKIHQLVLLNLKNSLGPPHIIFLTYIIFTAMEGH